MMAQLDEQSPGDMLSPVLYYSPLLPLQGENCANLITRERTGTASFPLHSVNPPAKPGLIVRVIPEERARIKLLWYTSRLRSWRRPSPSVFGRRKST
jgi:hypothetical protein